MKEGEQQFIGLLSDFVNGRRPENLTGLLFKEIRHLAAIHSLGPVIGYLINWHPQKKLLSQEDIDPFLQALYGCLERDRLVENVLEEMLSALDEVKVPRLLFKGIQVRHCYPTRELRTFGDVDVLIHTEDRKRCHEALKNAGFKVITDFSEVYTYQKESLHIEVHTNIMTVNMNGRADYKAYFRNCWSQAVPADHPLTYVFRPEYHFIYILAHLARHIYSGGAGIRMYMDLVFFSRYYGEELDWDWILQECDRLALTQFLYLSLAACHQWFGFEPPVPLQDVRQDTLDELTKYTLRGGVFGHHARGAASSRTRQVYRPGKNAEKKAKWKAVRMFLIPAYSTMKLRYPVLKKAPFLLPLFWAVRAVHGVFAYPGSGKRTLYGIRLAGPEIAEDYARLTRFGLTDESAAKL